MKLFHNLIADLGITIPERARYKRIWHVPFSGLVAANIVADYNFFAVAKTDNTGNYASDKKLVKNGDVTIFGIELKLNVSAGTFDQKSSLVQELIGYGRLELRRDTTLIESILSADIPGGHPFRAVMAVADTNGTTSINKGHVSLASGFMPIPGGILVQENDQFNILQKFNESGAAAVVQALTSLEIQYGIVLHTAVHDPQNNALGGCIMPPPSQQANNQQYLTLAPQ